MRHMMRFRVPVLAGVLTLIVTSPALAEDKKATDPCDKLPAVIKFEGGKYMLSREGARWTLDKPGPKSDKLLYSDRDDNDRVYEFKRWQGNQFTCFDMGYRKR